MTNTTSSRGAAWPLPLHAAALVVPLVLLALGTGLDRTVGGGAVDDYLDLVSAAPGLYLASGFLMVLGMAGLVVTAAALLALARDRARAALLRIGAVLLGLWGVFGVAGVSLGYTAGWVGRAVRSDVPDEALSHVFEGITYSPWGILGGAGGGVAYVLGVLATGVGLIVARGIPVWTGVLVLLAPVAMFTGGPLHQPLLAAAGFVIAATGLAGALAATRRRSPSESAPAAVERVPLAS